MNNLLCPICKNSDVENIGIYRNESAELGGKSRNQCSVCSLVFAHPMPTENEWDGYNRDYFSRAHGGNENAAVPRSFRKAIAKIRAMHVDKYLKKHNIKIERVLEIGAGHGEFLEVFKQRHADVEYLVVETDSNLFRHLDDLGATRVDTVGAITGKVDLVLVSHVLEHTIDPVSFLDMCLSPLRSGGALFVEVPCLDFLYKPLDEPHLLFFDKPAMQVALKSVKLSSIELTYHGERHAELQQQLKQNFVRRVVRKVATIIGRVAAKPKAPFTRQEWGIIKPFQAEETKSSPSRWLRAMAQK